MGKQSTGSGQKSAILDRIVANVGSRAMQRAARWGRGKEQHGRIGVTEDTESTKSLGLGG